MRKLVIGLLLVTCMRLAVAGAYDEILDAAEQRDSEKVVDLLRRGMDVNTADPQGNSLLMIAARTDNQILLKFLLENRANVNRRNRFGDSATLMGCVKGHLEIVKLLHAQGGDLEPPGWSCLHYSVFAQNGALADWLVGQRVKLDQRAPNGQTALMLAVKHGSMEDVKRLVDADADMDLQDFDGVTALGLARKLGKSGIADFLAEEGADE